MDQLQPTPQPLGAESCIDIASRLTLDDHIQIDSGWPGCPPFACSNCAPAASASCAQPCSARPWQAPCACIKDQHTQFQRLDAACCDKGTAVILAHRLERTRERNRAAQARYRQRLKAECDEVEARVHKLSTHVAAARERRGSLKTTQRALERRVATGMAAQLNTLQREQVASAKGPSGAIRNGRGATAPAECPSGHPLLLNLVAQHPAALLRTPAAVIHDICISPKPLLSSHSMPGLPFTPSDGSSALFTAPSLLPRPLESFPRQATISYADLLAASGSRSHVVDFSGATSWELLNQCMEAKVQGMGCAAEEVCWFAQMDYEAAPGLPLSFSFTLSTPECVASVALFHLVLYVECALISCLMQRPGFQEFDRVPAQHAQHAQWSVRRPRSKRVCCHTVTLPPAMHVTPPQTEACLSFDETVGPADAGSGCGSVPQHDSGSSVAADTHARCACDTAPAQRATAVDACVPCNCGCVALGPTSRRTEHSGGHHASGSCMAVRCGLNGSHCARAAARNVIGALVSRYRPCVSRAALEKICGASREHAMKTLELFLSQQPHPSPAGQASAQSTPASDTPMHEHPAGACAAQEHTAAAAAAFHAKVTETVVGMLHSMCDAFDASLADEESTQHPAVGTEGDGAARPSGSDESGSAEEGPPGPVLLASLEERIYAGLVSAAVGCMLAQRHAPRIFWSLASNSVFPRDSYAEVERLHVLLYKQLLLTEQQKGLYAANWRLWEHRRTANDAHTADVLRMLRALPESLDLPAHFMHHVAAVAAGSLGGDALEMDAAALDRHGRRLLQEGPRLLGACVRETAAAGAAVRTLWTVHEADAVTLAETIDLQIQPGALLEPPQIAQAFGVHLLHGSTPIDFMEICRLAAAERRRAAVTAALPASCAATPAAVCGAAARMLA